MKSKSLILLMLAASVATLGSCVKSPEQGPDTPNSGSTVKGLTVPAGFKWKLTETVQCNFTASHQTQVSVALSATDEPFASFIVGGDAEPVTLSIPTASKSVYVKYEKKDGTFAGTSLNVLGASLLYAVPADSKVYVPETSQATQAFRSAPVTRADDNHGMYVTYPASDWYGTLMFEDLWPSYGDYDFNDFVANYRIELIPQNKNQFRQMLLTVRVQAIGGTLPYDFYLGLTAVRPHEIATVERVRNFNGAATTAMELINPDDRNPAAVATFFFKDIQKNVKAPQGVAFMNTTKGGEMKSGDLVEVVFLVTFQNAIANRALSLDAFDFFIARSDQEREVHVAGFAPILYGADAYKALSSQPTSAANQTPEYYFSNDNLVWALNVPAEIPHAYEDKDFISAYPKFENWAKSGGLQDQEWYTAAAGNRVDANLVNLK